eukprot:767263-Hanusia_phi.AAC.11
MRAEGKRKIYLDALSVRDRQAWRGDGSKQFILDSSAARANILGLPLDAFARLARAAVFTSSSLQLLRSPRGNEEGAVLHDRETQHSIHFLDPL